MNAFWSALPFDDLRHYQEIGYNVKTGWLAAAIIVGIIVGIFAGANSGDVGGVAFFTVVASMFIFMIVGVTQSDDASQLRNSYADYTAYAQMNINHSLVNSCLLAGLFLMALCGTVAEVIRAALDD